jgi:hypothetical protein
VDGTVLKINILVERSQVLTLTLLLFVVTAEKTISAVRGSKHEAVYSK